MIEQMRNGIMADGLIDLISDLPANLTMLEIGCWQGESAEMFWKSGKIVKMYAVDPWIYGQRGIDAEKEFDRKMTGLDVIKLKMTMPEAIKYIESVNFVYIDGDHNYEWVRKDIIGSLQVLQRPGIIAGHDYSAKYNTMVIRAVDEILGKPDKTYRDTSWLKYIS